MIRSDTLFDQPGDDGPHVCETCGQRIRPEYKHHMDATKVRLLDDIARLNIRGVRWVKVQRNPRLECDEGSTIFTDDVHALRLKWFGLVETLAHRSGEYRPTADGFMFLAGRHHVPKTIWCKDGEVVRESPARVSVDQVKNVVCDKAYWDAYAQSRGGI